MATQKKGWYCHIGTLQYKSMLWSFLSFHFFFLWFSNFFYLKIFSQTECIWKQTIYIIKWFLFTHIIELFDAWNYSCWSIHSVVCILCTAHGPFYVFDWSNIHLENESSDGDLILTRDCFSVVYIHIHLLKWQKWLKGFWAFCSLCNSTSPVTKLVHKMYQSQQNLEKRSFWISAFLLLSARY